MMRTLSTVFVIALLFGLVVSGCMYFPDDCPDSPRPLMGSIEDYSTAAGEYEGVILHEPVPCENEEYQEGHMIVMEGQGTAFWISRVNEESGCPSADYQDCSVDQSYFEYGVMGDFSRAEIPFGESYEGLCHARAELDCGCYILIRDWEMADKAVEIMMEHVALRDIGECVVLVLAPEHRGCM